MVKLKRICGRAGAMALALVLMLTALAGCTSRADRENQRVIGESGGFDVLYEELRFVTLLVKDAMAGEYGADIWKNADTAEQSRAELEERVMDKLRANYMVLATCAAYGISTDSKEADNYVDRQIDQLITQECGGKTGKYKDYLKEHNLTDHYQRFALRVSYLESVLYYTLEAGKHFAYTAENIDEFVEFVLESPDYARTIHVFLRNDEGESPEQNLAEAKKITQALRAVSGTEQRQDVMNGYIGSALNDDLSMVSKDGYYFTRGEMDEIYEQNTFALQVGEVSDPFLCGNGYYVIMRLAPEAGYAMQNSSTLLKYYQSAQMGLLEESRAEACRVVLNEYGQSIDLVAME